MKSTHGFTVVEILASIVLLGVAVTAGYTLFENIRMTHRDQDRKVAINTIHANLQEVTGPKLGGYPSAIQNSMLPGGNNGLLTDPRGVTINEPTSDYRYEPTGCSGGDLCSGYSLIADLEGEADFIKSSR